MSTDGLELVAVGAQHFWMRFDHRTAREQQQQSRAESLRAPRWNTKYSPSDNSSSSSASLARTSAGSGTGSRSAIPPLETDLYLCFPPVSPSFLSSGFSRNPQKIQSQSAGVCRTLCGRSAVSLRHQRQAANNMALLLPVPLFTK